MLYEHQQQIIKADPKKCGLFLGTGSGKTRIALSLAHGKTLVVAPKTQFLDKNWPREKEKLGLNIDLTVISKEKFRSDHAKLPSYDTVILEEAHTVLGATPNVRWRNKQAIPKTSQIFEAVQSFIRRTNPERLYLLTATPARNPMCIWAAGVLLGKKWSWNSFRYTFYFKLPMPGREVWQPRKDSKSKDHLARLVKEIGYVGKLSDYFDVPPQTERVRHCALSLMQRKTIDELPLLYPEPLVLIGKTHQVEQGLLMEKVDNSKIEAIGYLLEEYPKVLVFARYLAQIDMIKEHFKGDMEVFVLTGDTKNRQEVIAGAEKSERCLFICQASISTGFEVPSFRCVVFASLSYSYTDLVQSMGRNLRANSLGSNLYVYLVSGEMDNAVLDCMGNHKDFSERLYAEKRSIVSNDFQQLVPAGENADRLL